MRLGCYLAAPEAQPVTPASKHPEPPPDPAQELIACHPNISSVRERLLRGTADTVSASEEQDARSLRHCIGHDTAAVMSGLTGTIAVKKPPIPKDRQNRNILL
jgi:hypothetical protein